MRQSRLNKILNEHKIKNSRILLREAFDDTLDDYDYFYEEIDSYRDFFLDCLETWGFSEEDVMSLFRDMIYYVSENEMKAFLENHGFADYYNAMHEDM